MTERPRRVRFQGIEYVLTSGGALARREDFEAFEPSFAHVLADGRIMRFGHEIGVREDLEDLGPSDTEGPRLEAFLANVGRWLEVRRRGSHD